MNYFEKNRRWKDFFISFLLLLAMVVVIFSFIGVSEGATNKDTDNNSSNSKNINESVGNVSNSDSKSFSVSNSSKDVLNLYGGIRGYNESSNVILEFNVTPTYMANTVMCGGSRSYFYLDVFLRYKENNSPLSNQIVYLIIGNETTSFITNEDGIVHYLYLPNIFGLVTFGAIFNESSILDNGSFIDLEPVSVFGNYYINEPYYNPHLRLWPHANILNLSDFYLDILIIPGSGTKLDLSSSKDFDIIKSNYSSNFSKNMSKSGNNSQIAYSKMKKTGIQLIHFILSLIAVLAIGFKRYDI